MRATTVTAATTALVLGAVTAAAVVASQQDAGPAVRVAPRGAALRQATPANERRSTRSTKPTYLPPGAQSVSTQSFDLPTGLTETVQEFSLPGNANSDTVPVGGLTASNAKTTHPATHIVVSFIEGLTTPQETPADPTYFNQMAVNIGGNDGVVTWRKDGLSTVRVDWVDSDGWHSVLCDRLTTPDGVSGVDRQTIMRIAASLY